MEAPPAEEQDVLGARCFVGDLDSAARHVIERALSGNGGYGVFCNVHVLMTSRRQPDVARALERAWAVFPDGAPVAWLQRRLAMPDAQRIGGPDLMPVVFDQGRSHGLRHALFGSTPAVVEALQCRMRARYPGAEIVLADAPARGDEEDETVLARLAEARPHIVWCALGAPKQELWMARHAAELSPMLVLGVGRGVRLSCRNQRARAVLDATYRARVAAPSRQRAAAPHRPLRHDERDLHGRRRGRAHSSETRREHWEARIRDERTCSTRRGGGPLRLPSQRRRRRSARLGHRHRRPSRQSRRSRNCRSDGSARSTRSATRLRHSLVSVLRHRHGRLGASFSPTRRRLRPLRHLLLRRCGWPGTPRCRAGRRMAGTRGYGDSGLPRRQARTQGSPRRQRRRPTAVGVRLCLGSRRRAHRRLRRGGKATCIFARPRRAGPRPTPPDRDGHCPTAQKPVTPRASELVRNAADPAASDPTYWPRRRTRGSRRHGKVHAR